MKAAFLGLVLLAVIVSAFLSFKTTPSGPSIAGDWVGAWDVQTLGTASGEPKAERGNAVVEIHLRRNIFTMLHRYSGTGVVHPVDEPSQSFKILDVNVFPSGEFNGFMVGAGSAAQDGGEFSGTFNGATLTFSGNRTHTMSNQMQGVLQKGDHQAAEDLYQRLTEASKKP
ncbi:hypothetical protein [Granulicella sp. S156]|jgi:hypothetical protein|uniref:hypothetical protein n=1 Tax=Granulicella sp. S156 TaxID=1747224 RepID=UPI00131B17B0|nr:hypothetical protein [Granulicella sp. S156]